MVMMMMYYTIVVITDIHIYTQPQKKIKLINQQIKASNQESYKAK